MGEVHFERFQSPTLREILLLNGDRIILLFSVNNVMTYVLILPRGIVLLVRNSKIVLPSLKLSFSPTSHPIVIITASGLQGEQPLFDGTI